MDFFTSISYGAVGGALVPVIGPIAVAWKLAIISMATNAILSTLQYYCYCKHHGAVLVHRELEFSLFKIS